MTHSCGTSNGLRGIVEMPGDKSISHRALMIASLARGRSVIRGLSLAAAPISTINCLRSLGVQIVENNGETIVQGKGLFGFAPPTSNLDAGNSATSMRLLAGILAGQRFEVTLVGDDSLQRRPMERVAIPLRLMGAEIALTESGTAPMSIRGGRKLTGIEYSLPVPSAQVKSAILFAGLGAEGESTVREKVQSRDHTERMLGLETRREGSFFCTSIRRGNEPVAKEFHIPGDVSSATFFIVAALITRNSELTIRNVGVNPTRTEFIDVLRKVGASIEIQNQRTIAGEAVADLSIRSSELHGDISLEGDSIPRLVDEIPILAVAAMFTRGTFTVRNAKELRLKESDRATALVRNLRTLGNEVEEYEDGFAFQSRKMNIGCEIDSFGDHRIAMAFGIAGLAIGGVRIRDAECVSISFPEYWEVLKRLSN